LDAFGNSSIFETYGEICASSESDVFTLPQKRECLRLVFDRVFCAPVNTDDKAAGAAAASAAADQEIDDQSALGNQRVRFPAPASTFASVSASALILAGCEALSDVNVDGDRQADVVAAATVAEVAAAAATAAASVEDDQAAASLAAAAVSAVAAAARELEATSAGVASPLAGANGPAEAAEPARAPNAAANHHVAFSAVGTTLLPIQRLLIQPPLPLPKSSLGRRVWTKCDFRCER
jgi:hypothetical protein